MDGGNYPQQGPGAPPPHMVGYFQGMPGYNPSSGPAPPPSSSAPGAPGSSPGARQSSSISIWAGDLDAYMDENFLRQAVSASGWAQDITRIKVVRDHYTGMHAGYGFLDAASPEAAERVIATGSGMPIPGTNRCWRLNMGRNAAVNAPPGAAAGTEINIYVGNLEPSVTDYQLMTAFRPRYASVRHAKVVCNEYGQSRGFGFVRFANPQDAERAVSEMQGFEFNSKPIRLSPATGRNRGPGSGRGPGGYGNHGGSSHHGGPHGAPNNKRPRQVMSPDDPNNTTIFIGGTGSHITEELLWREFSSFGDLDAVRVPVNKTGFAFVRFKRREDALRAKEELSGTHYVSLNPNKPVRVEWASEQIAITKPPALGQNSMPHMYSNSGAPQSYDPQYNPPYNPPHHGMSQGSGQSPFGSYQPSVTQAGSSAPMATSSSGSATPVSQAAASAAPNGVAKKEENITAGNELPGGPTPGNDAPGAKSDAHGETEPPSKRAAVGRPEYGGPGNDAASKEGIGDAKPDGVADDSPAMQFSWLNASSTQSASNPQ